VLQIDRSALTAGLAVAEQTAILLHNNVGLGVLASLAKNKLGDETVKQILKLGRVVRTVDVVSVVSLVDRGLSTKLKSEKLDNVDRRTGKSTCDIRGVHDGSTDTITSTLNLRDDQGHLVSVKGIIVISANVDERHGD
jgi:hypothetical protein